MRAKKGHQSSVVFPRKKNGLNGGKVYGVKISKFSIYYIYWNCWRTKRSKDFKMCFYNYILKCLNEFQVSKWLLLKSIMLHIGNEDLCLYDIQAMQS